MAPVRVKRTRAQRRADRYQFQNWLVRRWRDRHLLAVPGEALYLWVRLNWNRPKCISSRVSWDHAWTTARGMADLRREYLYDFDDLNEDLSLNERAHQKEVPPMT